MLCDLLNWPVTTWPLLSSHSAHNLFLSSAITCQHHTEAHGTPTATVNKLSCSITISVHYFPCPTQFLFLRLPYKLSKKNKKCEIFFTFVEVLHPLFVLIFHHFNKMNQVTQNITFWICLSINNKFLKLFFSFMNLNI